MVIAKWLQAQPDIFLMDEPTAGVDIGAKTEIIAIIRRLAGELGKGVLLVSSELPELLAVRRPDPPPAQREGGEGTGRSGIESEASLHHMIQGT